MEPVMKHWLIGLMVIIAAGWCRGVEIRSELRNPQLTPGCQWDDGTLTIMVPSGADAKKYNARFKIDLSRYAGQYLTGKIKFKTEGFTPNSEHLSGIELRISYPAEDNSHERLGGGKVKADAVQAGLLEYSVSLDPHVRQCDVQFSMINASGKVVFNLADFGFEPLFARKLTDWRCEYSPDVRNRPVHRGVVSPIRDQDHEEHFKTLRSWGANLLRLQLNTSDIWARKDPVRYRAFIEEKIEKTIPRVLAMAQKYGLKVIIDLHTVPGSAIMRDGDDAIFGSERDVKEFVAIWKRIATKFRDHPALYGYDLINEPKQTRRAIYDYLEIQRLAAEAIRQIDHETPIYVESNMMASPLAFCYMEPLRLKNIIYQIHFYEPFDYTHFFIMKQSDLKNDKVKRHIFPGQYYGTYWGEDLVQMRKKVQYVKEFEKHYGAKIYVGEFSAPAYAPGAEQYLAGAIKVFEENGWDWTYHAFREAKIWDVECIGTANDDLHPVSDTPRKTVLLKAFERNGGRQ